MYIDHEEVIRDRFYYDDVALKYRFTEEYAGSVSEKGTPYLRVTVLGQQFYVHRICWFLKTGKWPETNVDHINGDKLDNSWTNLRLATHSQNGCNSVKSNNTSGCKNVYWSNTRNRWVIDITLNNVRVFHKVMENYDDAVVLAKEKMNELHGEFARYE